MSAVDAWQVALDVGEELALKPALWLIYREPATGASYDVMPTGRVAHQPPGPKDNPRIWLFPYIGVIKFHEYIEPHGRLPLPDTAEQFISWRNLYVFEPLLRYNPIRALDMSQKA